MSEFSVLTKYIAAIQTDNIGSWIVDKGNNGTIEQPIHMSYVECSPIVKNFIDDVYAFAESNRDMELTSYIQILKDCGHDWGNDSIENIDVAMGHYLIISTVAAY